MEVLRSCRLKTPESYSYTTVALKTETEQIRSEDELYAKMPMGAAKLKAEFSKAHGLSLQMTITGRYETNTAYDISDLAENCSSATHIITAVTVGAFTLEHLDETAIDGKASIGPAEAGGHHGKSKRYFKSGGKPETCNSSKSEDGPPIDCSEPLRVELQPLQGAQNPPVQEARRKPRPPRQKRFESSWAPFASFDLGIGGAHAPVSDTLAPLDDPGAISHKQIRGAGVRLRTSLAPTALLLTSLGEQSKRYSIATGIAGEARLDALQGTHGSYEVDSLLELALGASAWFGLSNWALTGRYERFLRRGGAATSDADDYSTLRYLVDRAAYGVRFCGPRELRRCGGEYSSASSRYWVAASLLSDRPLLDGSAYPSSARERGAILGLELASKWYFLPYLGAGAEVQLFPRYAIANRVEGLQERSTLSLFFSLVFAIGRNLP
ncbi:MAG: hypothetical protein AAF799_00720 [Myxococcota bacterium]